MKALCVTPSRELELRDIPRPEVAESGHVLVEIVASAINHGDKTFLRMPGVAGSASAASEFDVWGASAAGRVLAVGAGVPASYLGAQVAVYRSIRRTPRTLGLWSERAHVHFASCLIIPEQVQAMDYCGSLVNVLTAYAFLEQMTLEGHRGVIITAGNSATGYAMAALVQKRGIPAIFLVRNEAARVALLRAGVEHVLVTEGGYGEELAALAEQLHATAVFEGVGGALPGQIAAYLPMNSTIYFYGFLGGPAPFALTSALFMTKNLSLKRFSNFESATVRDEQRLQEAKSMLAEIISDPLFRTTLGATFTFAQVDDAMAYAGVDGAKAILVPG